MQYDILFIGGGPAGYEGAIAAARNGRKTAVVEMDQVGGTCLQRGCIPTKAILHSIKALKIIRHSAKLGIEVEGVRVNLEEIRKRKTRVVQKLTRGIETLFKGSGVELLRGRAFVTKPHTVRIGDGAEVTAENIVLASGSRPAELPFLRRDGERVLLSDDMLKLEHIPPRLLVIGAGAVGLEWALIYAYLGSRVTVVEIMEQVLPGSDGEIAAQLRNELIKQDLTIHTATALQGVERGEELTCTFRQGEKTWNETFSHILLSVGRLPNSDGLYAEDLGIVRDARGFIQVDERLATAVPGIYACGDLIGAPLLAHKASHQAIAIVNHLVHGSAVHHTPIPAAVFTFPEVASIGLSEEEAKKRDIPIEIGRFPYAAGSRANAVEEKTGLVKIIADKKHRLLGAHIIGAEAGELMPLLSYAVQHQLPAEHFADLVFIHPTLSENVWEALGTVGRFAIHI